MFFLQAAANLFPSGVILPHIDGPAVEVDSVGDNMDMVVARVLMTVGNPCGFTEPHFLNVGGGDLLPLFVAQLFTIGQRQTHVGHILFHPLVHLPVNAPLPFELRRCTPRHVPGDSFGSFLAVDVAGQTAKA